MTSNNDKIRAVFLAALMVLSVMVGTIALTGTAAASSPTFVSAVEYNDTAADSDPGDIELVFADNASQASDPSSALTLGGNITIFMNDNNITSRFTRDRTTNSRARYILNSSTDLTPNATVTISVNNASDGNDNFASFDNKTVQVTASQVALNISNVDTLTEFKGAPIALNFSANGTDTTYEITEDGDPFKGPFSSGTNSTLAVFDTSTITVGSTYNVTIDTDDDGFGDSRGAEIKFRTLSVSGTAADTSIQTDDNPTVNIELSAGNRQVEVRLENDSLVGKQIVTVDGNGEATVEFNQVDAGDYTAEAIDVQSGVSDSTDTISVSEVPDGDASFAESVFSDNRGDVVELTVELTGTTTADIQLGTNDTGYNVSFTVNDGDDDGEVVVLFDTFATTGDADAALDAKDSDDSLSGFTDTTSSLTNPIAVGAYDLSVEVGGDEKDVAQVNVQDRSTDSLTTSVAPNAKGVASRSDILDHATASDEVSTFDDLVVTIDGSGLEGNFSGQLSPERLNSTRDGLSLNITEQNPGQNTDPIELTGDATSVDIIDDTANDTVYAVIDVSDAGFEKGDEVELEFIVDGDESPLLSSGTTETVSGTFTVLEDTASFDDDPIVVRSAADQAITGTTTRAPGTDLTVTVKSAGKFLKTNSKVTVQEDRTWSVDFDFSGQDVGTEFEATVKAPSASADGKISGPATVSLADQSSSGTKVTVGSVDLPAGGFVAIHEGSPGGPIVGATNFLASGEHADVSVTLDEPYEESQTVTLVAMAHKDTDGDKVFDFVTSNASVDGPYKDNGSAVTSSASVTVERATPTPRVVTVEQPSPTPKVVEETVVKEKTVVKEVEKTVIKEVTQTPGQPGFGIAVAIMALLAAALLALRRRD